MSQVRMCGTEACRLRLAGMLKMSLRIMLGHERYVQGVSKTMNVCDLKLVLITCNIVSNTNVQSFLMVISFYYSRIYI